MTTPFRLIAALGLTALALSACGSSSRTSDTGAARSLSDAAAAPQMAAMAPKAAARPSTVEQVAIISTGTVALSSPDVARDRAKVEQLAATYAAQISQEETSTTAGGRPSHARLVLRVPAASFAKAMDDLGKIARLVDSSRTSKDVSTQVIDVDERVKSARASIERIRTLLTRASKIGDVIAIESELSSREADLNSLLAQQTHLADQTALSTITVSIDRHARAVHHQESDSGFLAGLGGGWHALRAVGTGVATVSGVLLPWLPVILILGVPAWLLARRRRLTAAGEE